MKLLPRVFVGLVLLVCLGTWVALWWVEHRAGAVNYTLIEEGLYMGGDVNEPPPGTTAVLNLCSREDPYSCEVESWKPINDAAPAPSLDWLRERVDFVEKQRDAGRTVYVHCRQGASRSGMVVVAYLMHRHGWSRDEALEFARSKRDVVRPHPAFMELLLEWEQELGKREHD